jgi:hypothetical protein
MQLGPACQCCCRPGTHLQTICALIMCHCGRLCLSSCQDHFYAVAWHTHYCSCAAGAAACRNASKAGINPPFTCEASLAVSAYPQVNPMNQQGRRPHPWHLPKEVNTIIHMSIHKTAPVNAGALLGTRALGSACSAVVRCRQGWHIAPGQQRGLRSPRFASTCGAPAPHPSSFPAPGKTGQHHAHILPPQQIKAWI